jgi:hypothetical protein
LRGAESKAFWNSKLEACIVKQGKEEEDAPEYFTGHRTEIISNNTFRYGNVCLSWVNVQPGSGKYYVTLPLALARRSLV